MYGSETRPDRSEMRNYSLFGSDFGAVSVVRRFRGKLLPQVVVGLGVALLPRVVVPVA